MQLLKEPSGGFPPSEDCSCWLSE